MSYLRRKVAKLATEFYEGGISYEEFINEMPEMDKDELIDELVDLIEHEPKQGVIFGVGKKDHSDYIDHVFRVIEKLKK